MKQALWTVFLLSILYFPAGYCEEQPPMELIQFLGEWEDEQGKPVNPFDYLDQQPPPEPQRPQQPPQQNDQRYNDE